MAATPLMVSSSAERTLGVDTTAQGLDDALAGLASRR
jgi:hypothetical protein